MALLVFIFITSSLPLPLPALPRLTDAEPFLGFLFFFPRFPRFTSLAKSQVDWL